MIVVIDSWLSILPIVVFTFFFKLIVAIPLFINFEERIKKTSDSVFTAIICIVFVGEIFLMVYTAGVLDVLW